MDARVTVGCCGFPMAQERYMRLFPAVEVQATFYDPPSPATLSRWREKAPRGFTFTVKAWQVITHGALSPTYRRMKRSLPHPPETWGGFQDTPAVREAWEVTAQSALLLGAPVVLLQCPASFRPEPGNLERMRRFLASLDRRGLQLAWEPRGLWPSELVHALCEEFDLVWAVDPLARTGPLPPRARYFRLHGGPRFRHRYTDEELAALARLCREHPGPEVWVFFNNVSMAEDAARFLSLVGTPRT